LATFGAFAAFPLLPIAVLGLNKLHLPQPHTHAPPLDPGRSVVDLLRHRVLRHVFVASGLLAAAWDMFTFAIPIYGSRIGLSASSIGLVLGSFSVATFVIRGLLPAISKRLTAWPQVGRRILAMDLPALRQEYMRAGLHEKDLQADPLAQFGNWFDEALQSGVVLPNAMTLATATKKGRPSARAVLLKGFDALGFVFYTHYRSRKGRELEENPQAMLLFCWTELERQVGIEGRVARVSAAESDEYFASRPLGSRLSATISPQSEPVASREALEIRLEEASKRFRDSPPRPAHRG